MNAALERPATQEVNKPAFRNELPQPPTMEEIRILAHEIYVAHGGARKMTLDEWRMAEQELKQILEDEYSRHLPDS